MTKGNNIESFWDKAARKFDKGSKRYNRMDEFIINHTIEHLNTEDAMLDFGCGSGNFSLKLYQNVKKTVGVDISSAMIEKAKNKSTKIDLNKLSFKKINNPEEDIKKESYDIVLAFNVLHLMENPEQTLQTLSNSLKAGGRLISATPCLRQKCFTTILFKMIGKIMRVPYLTFYKIEDIEKLMTESGLTIVDSEIQAGSVPHYFISAQKNH